LLFVLRQRVVLLLSGTYLCRESETFFGLYIFYEGDNRSLKSGPRNALSRIGNSIFGFFSYQIHE